MPWCPDILAVVGGNSKVDVTQLHFFDRETGEVIGATVTANTA